MYLAKVTYDAMPILTEMQCSHATLDSLKSFFFIVKEANGLGPCSCLFRDENRSSVNPQSGVVTDQQCFYFHKGEEVTKKEYWELVNNQD
jgi:hypothetical protein